MKDALLFVLDFSGATTQKLPSGGTLGALGSDFPAILALAKQQDGNKLDTENNGKV